MAKTKLKDSAVYLIFILVFSSGILNILSTFFSRVPARILFLEEIMPLEITNFSRSATIIAGMFLIFLSRGLLQRKKRAWFFSFILIAASAILHLAKGFDFEEAAVLTAALIALLLTKEEFYVESSSQKVLDSVKSSAVILLFLLIYAFGGFFLLKNQFNKKITISRVIGDYQYSIFGLREDPLKPRTRRAMWFEDSITTVGFGVILLFFTNIFFPAEFFKTMTKEEYEKAKNLILKYAQNPTSYMGLLPDKQFFFTKDQDAVICYKTAQTVSVVLGDPICQKGKERQTIEEFTDALKQKGSTPTFLSVTPQIKEIFESLGYKSLKIGEDALIYTQLFTLEGKKVEDIRHGVSRMQREGVYYKWFTQDAIPQEVQIELKLLHELWLKSRKISGLTFSVDFYPLPKEAKGYLLAVYSKDNQLQASFSFFPYKQSKGFALDLMLRGQETINGLMEASIAESIRYFKAIGADEVSLGVAPLADVEPEESKNLLNKTTGMLFKNFNQFYNYQSLFKFKDKFNPSWEPRYLVYPSNTKLISVSIAAISVHLQSGLIKTITKR